MMKKSISKVFLGLVFLFCIAVTAQKQPPPPVINPNSTGQGGPAQPIDMFVFWLGILAISFIVYFVRKYKSKIV